MSAVFRRFGSSIQEVLHGPSIPHVDLRNRLFTTFSFTVMVSGVATFALFLAERGHQESDIANLWDAFYFTVSQLSTLGSDMNNPVTTTGQIIVLLINVFAITVVSTLAGIFGAYFYHRTDQRHRAHQAAASDGD